MTEPTDTTQFGARQVPLADKQALVDDVFRSVARRYDLMNDLMSFGLHRAWKDALVTALDPPQQRPFALLDIAGGTVCDINAAMLAVGRERTEQHSPSLPTPASGGGIGRRISFTEANAEA